MKKINLNKQRVFKLSEAEQQNIHGGGIKRSRNRDGDCKYSREHPSEKISIKPNGEVSGVSWCMSSMD